MKLWIDDVRPAPEGYIWCKSVYDAIGCIWTFEKAMFTLKWEYDTADMPIFSKHTMNRSALLEKMDEYRIELIDLDHDAGDFACNGGDYIKLLDWLEETGRNHPIRIHSANAVGVANMRRIIERNGWKEIRQWDLIMKLKLMMTI
jgi:hypothetical protein